MNISSEPLLFEKCVHVGGDFDIYIYHRSSVFSSNEMHSHDFCEITVYAEGNKSVFVNDSIYISKSGCAFTFRPGELHCGLHSGTDIHRRYVITIRPDSFRSIRGGESLLRCLFDREVGRNNMVVMPEAETAEGLRLLEHIMEVGSSDLPEREAVVISDLIRYLCLLNAHYLDAQHEKYGPMPDLLRAVINYIDENISDKLTVRGLAERFGVSVSTFERLFSGILNTTPQKFIAKRRIENAKRLLQAGCTVTDACYASGFGDYSYFIASFKREVGVTPYQYCKVR